MRKTKLMELADRASQDRTVYNNTTIIDNTAYMLAEMAEHAFGPDIIMALEEYLIFTQTGINRRKALFFITNEFIHKHLTRHIRGVKEYGYAKDLDGLKEFTDANHTEYFVAFLKLDRVTQGNLLDKACADMQKLLAGCVTETPFSVCQTIADFFTIMKDDYGMMLLIKEYCLFIKREAAEEPEETGVKVKAGQIVRSLNSGGTRG